MASAPGEPLVVMVPITNITAQDAESLKVQLAPANAWQAAQATLPVPLDSMRVVVEEVVPTNNAELITCFPETI